MSSVVDAAVTAETPVAGRRRRRLLLTQEIQIRTAHRRRKVLTRGGVLVGFALAMVVYPVLGTISPYADAVESVPGVAAGDSPTTALALLGGGPDLLSSDLPLPSVADEAKAIATQSTVIPGTPLPDCDPTAAIKGSNGRLASSSLCTLWNGMVLQPEAAISFAALNEHYNIVFGRDLCVYQTYRTIGEQYSVKATRGYLAAAPGTSMHGWGVAVDFCNSDVAGASGKWLRENAGTYGWINPNWAKGSKYEPWHWEYRHLAEKYYEIQWGPGTYDSYSY